MIKAICLSFGYAESATPGAHCYLYRGDEPLKTAQAALGSLATDLLGVYRAEMEYDHGEDEVFKLFGDGFEAWLNNVPKSEVHELAPEYGDMDWWAAFVSISDVFDLQRDEVLVVNEQAAEMLKVSLPATALPEQEIDARAGLIGYQEEWYARQLELDESLVGKTMAEVIARQVEASL